MTVTSDSVGQSNAEPRADEQRSGMNGIVIDRLPTQMVPSDSLVPCGWSPRLSGQDGKHVQALAQVESRLPPILVHRPTMRVIDGMHRLAAAKLRGDREVEVRFFDGEDQAAFVLAVQTNVGHGMPLTLAERTAAATQILSFYPHWSDRAIARSTGLAAATVGRIRRCSTVQNEQSNTRLSQDGRVRPLDAAEGRRRASELVARKPDAPLREIAREAGISLATVQDVRERLSQGHDPVPAKHNKARQHSRQSRSTTTRERAAAEGDYPRRPPTILERLRKDPSLRSSETGRALLRWLAANAASTENWPEFIEQLPKHSTIMVVEIARAFAQNWDALAEKLERDNEKS